MKMKMWGGKEKENNAAFVVPFRVCHKARFPQKMS